MKKTLVLVAGLFISAITIASLNFYGSSSATVPGNNTLVSINNTGDGQGGDAFTPSSLYFQKSASKISKNGRYVAFGSSASNLVNGDTNGKRDIFMRDLGTNTTSRVSLAHDGSQLSGDSDLMDISENGRYVLFLSVGTGIVPAPNFGPTSKQLYLRDTKTGAVSLISRSTAANNYFGNLISGASVSHDGRFILVDTQGYVESTTGNSSYFHVYVYDLLTQAWTIMDNPKPEASSQYSQMSCDGAYIVFESTATNLTPNDTNGFSDIFLVDRRAGDKITNITHSANGSNTRPVISCNGAYIGFLSRATNLAAGTTGTPDVYGHYIEYDRISESYTVLDVRPNGTISGSIGSSDMFLDIDDKGNAVFFTHDSFFAGSPNAKRVYLRNMATGTTETLSLNSSGVPNTVDLNAVRPRITADGRHAIFGAPDTANIIPSDTNGQGDLFLAETGL